MSHVQDWSVSCSIICYPKVQFVIVLMPFPRDDVYSAIKRFCVVEKGIPSQVILSKTLNNEKNQRSVMQKVALQINCKLGGALWSLKIPVVRP